MASKTITAFERVVLLFDKTFVCTNRSARRLCALQCFYVQHADCAVDIILSFNSSRTTPVRGYWGSRVWHGYTFQTFGCIKKSGIFLQQESASCTEKNPGGSFFSVQLLLPGNLQPFFQKSQKILSLFTEHFTSPADTSVNKLLSVSGKRIFHGGISRITS